MQYKTITFYNYVLLENPEQLRDEIRFYCEKLHLKGRILIAAEGINAAVSGATNEVESFKKIITAKTEFKNIAFREQNAEAVAHHKLVVRVRKEIVAFGKKVDVHNTAEHLSPQTLKQWYDERKHFTIVDVRNDYEYKVGRFQNAIGLPLHNFRDFSSQLPFFQQHKEETIVLYCTGGIRCEKASAFLKENGINKVFQIEGGIINYVNQFPHTYWQGGVFVFDDRIVSETNKPITPCQFCDIPSEKYTNCHNLECDKLFIACTKCLEQMNNTCSQKCQCAPRQREEKKQGAFLSP